jgi:hypothetical protein
MAWKRKSSASLLFVTLAGAIGASCGGAGDEALFVEAGAEAGGNGGSGGSGASGGLGGGAGLDGSTSGSGGADAQPDSAIGDAPVSDGGAGASEGGCAIEWCPDLDGDAHGDMTQKQLSCQRPQEGWVTVCDDCHDGNAAVHPGAGCNAEPYEVTGGTDRSFDYDCDGVETECGVITKAQTCTITGLSGCGGHGYLPNPERPAGESQNEYCGSTQWRQCGSFPIGCSGTTQQRPAVTCQ